MLSPGGRCFTFNASANGYNRGDGTAAMLMKATGANEVERVHKGRGMKGDRMGYERTQGGDESVSI